MAHENLKGNFKLNECMRQIYEPLFKQYGVDVVLQGHSHAYERTYPMVGLSPTATFMSDLARNN